MKRARQTEFGFTNWGGKRRGAGRRPKSGRSAVSHGKRPALCARFPVHVTMRFCRGLPGLRCENSHRAIQSALRAASAHSSFRVVHYSVQTNHLHLVVEAGGAPALSSGMRGLAVRIARALNRLWRRRGQVLAERYHGRILKTPREVRNALLYVLQNARKHGAWRAPRPDVYSSGPAFDGWKASAAGLGETTLGFFVCARTWLLSVGWRRHGRLDVRAGPRASPAVGFG